MSPTGFSKKEGGILEFQGHRQTWRPLGSAPTSEDTIGVHPVTAFTLGSCGCACGELKEELDSRVPQNQITGAWLMTRIISKLQEMFFLILRPRIRQNNAIKIHCIC